MAVVVAYKWASNPQNASVGTDGVVDWERAKASLSEYDPVAIEVGRQIADSVGTELVGVSVGTEAVASSIAKKGAMSRGFDRGQVIADDTVASWNLTQVAQAVAQLVSRVEGADILLTGDASIDENAKMIPALAAGYLGWACFQDVVSVQKAADGWDVTQTVPGGVRNIRVTGPVVAAIASDATQPRVPGMKDIMAAGKKQVEVVPVSDLDITPIEVDVVGRRKPDRPVRKNLMFEGTDAVVQLVAALKSDGLV